MTETGQEPLFEMNLCLHYEAGNAYRIKRVFEP
jgi:hypothetical protein